MGEVSEILYGMQRNGNLKPNGRELLVVLEKGTSVQIFGEWGLGRYSHEDYDGTVCHYCGGGLDRHASVPTIEIEHAHGHIPYHDEECAELEVRIDKVFERVVGFACQNASCHLRQKQAAERTKQLLASVFDFSILEKDLQHFSSRPEVKGRPEKLLEYLFQADDKNR